MIKLHENFQKLLEFSSPSAIIVHIQWKYSSAGMSVRLTRERSWVRAPLLPRKTTQDMRRVLRSAWFLLFFLFLRIIQINPLQIVLLADDPALVRHSQRAFHRNGNQLPDVLAHARIAAECTAVDAEHVCVRSGIIAVLVGRHVGKDPVAEQEMPDHRIPEGLEGILPVELLHLFGNQGGVSLYIFRNVVLQELPAELHPVHLVIPALVLQVGLAVHQTASFLWGNVYVAAPHFAALVPADRVGHGKGQAHFGEHVGEGLVPCGPGFRKFMSLRARRV